MTNGRLRYSDEMARRIQCLRKGSFECLITGGVYNEEEAAAILPYLDVSYSGDGFCVAVVRAQLDESSVLSSYFVDEAPASVAARVIARRIGRRGCAHLRREVVTLFWAPGDRDEVAGLRRLLVAAGDELLSRHKVRIACGIGGWYRRLMDAPLSHQAAERTFQESIGAREIVVDVSESSPPDTDLGEFSFAAKSLSSCPAELCAREPARTIQEYIFANYRDPNLTLSRVAEEFGLTETYLSQLFKEQAGVNYSIYLESVRTSEAQRLLVDTDLAVSEAAARVGYSINSTFYRAFKRRFGVSPSAYRGRSGVNRPEPTVRAIESVASVVDEAGDHQERAM